MQRIRRVLLAWLGGAGLLGALLGPAVVSADPPTSWTAGPGAALDNTYDGFVDVPNSGATVPTGAFAVAGWFVDKTAQGWAGADDIQVWQGSMDGGGQLLARATIAQNRPDVAAAEDNPFWAASGFSGVVPPNSLASGPQTLSVYAHTGSKGWWYKQVNVNVSSSPPATASSASAASAAAAAAPTVSGGALPIVVVEQPANGATIKVHPVLYEMIGYALDQNATPNQGSQSSGIDHVSVYANADKSEGGLFLGDADLAFNDAAAQAAYGPQFASSGWRVTFKPTILHSGSRTLFVYAHSVVTNKENLATVSVSISET